MKKHFLFMTFALGSLLVPTHAAPHSELETQMEAVDDAFKGFRRESDPVKGAEQARAAQTATLKAIPELPAMVKAMPAGSEKDKASASYRKMMAKLLVVFCEVEEAFLAGNTEEVAKIVAAVREMKKEGHDKFMDDSE
jgi:hypothetical protein